MSRIFDVVRLVDPKRGEILQLNADGTFSDRVLPCSPVWNHGKRCSRCISCRCMEDKTRMSKLELTDECAYQLISRYLSWTDVSACSSWAAGSATAFG